MKNISDVIVIGGGPCGSFAALNTQKRHANVTVFEEHEEIGVPSHCAGHLSIEGLRRLGLYPLPSNIVENLFRGATFYSPHGKTFTIRFSSPVTCVVNRILFDKYLAGLAKSVGTFYHMNSRVESLVVENGFVKGVNVEQESRKERFLANVVIDAEGVSARLLKQIRLRTTNSRWVVKGVEAEIENVKDVEADGVEVYLGEDYAPGFYAWLIPTNDGKAKIGLGAKNGNPEKLLQRLIRKHPIASKKLNQARILQATFHVIPLGGPIAKTFFNGILAVGDVASHVKPTTGGGIVWGLTAAGIAANVVCEASSENDFSAEFLGSYQKLCKKTLGFDAQIMREMRRFFDVLSDKQIDDVVGFCARLNLDRVLSSFQDVDFQGRSLLRVARNPRMIAAFIYLLYVYLSANPLKTVR